MPKYDYLPGFMREWSKLTPAQQKAFAAVVSTIVRYLKAGLGFPPPPLVQKMTDLDIYEVRWGPNGRATFHIEHDAQGEIIVVWRRIGDHSIFNNP